MADDEVLLRSLGKLYVQQWTNAHMMTSQNLIGLKTTVVVCGQARVNVERNYYIAARQFPMVVGGLDLVSALGSPFMNWVTDHPLDNGTKH